MNNLLLLPHSFKMIGWFLFIPSFVFGVFHLATNAEFQIGTMTVPAIFYDTISQNKANQPNAGFILTDITNTFAGVLIIISALMVAFSRTKQEDEYIKELRLSSLLWAVWVHYVLLLIAFLVVYGGTFLQVMMCNMFTILIIFIARFEFLLFKSRTTITQ
jgi:hypothetical protein